MVDVFAAAAKPPRLQGLPPVISATCVLLVLGSFPGEASLRAEQYYGHPQNHFWPILGTILAGRPMSTGTSSYAFRSNWLLDHGVGLWDVYASCERSGSLDSAIRHAEPNDFARLRSQCPDLRVVAHNGAESYRHAPRVLQAMAGTGAALPLSLRLPSTSPANASWSLARKLDAWREAVAAAGLPVRG